jgi:hypothetical protein
MIGGSVTVAGEALTAPEVLLDGSESTRPDWAAAKLEIVAMRSRESQRIVASERSLY